MNSTKRTAEEMLEEYASYYSQVDLEQLTAKLDQLKSEARREFSERLKEYLCLYDLPDYHCFKAVEEEVIDDLLKEMESESQ